MPTSRSSNGLTRSGSAARARRTSRRHLVSHSWEPNGIIRKSAKALDNGVAGEVDIHRTLIGRSCLMDVWRNHGIFNDRVTGVRSRPDMAGYMVELEGLAVECAPTIQAWRPSYNIFIEVKRQTSSGSAYQKIFAELVDMAHISDATGAIGIAVLDVPALSPVTIEAMKQLGRKHLIVVLTRKELNRTSVREEAIRVARERRKLAKFVGPRRGLRLTKKRLSDTELAFAGRWRDRRASAYRLNQMGVAALV